MMQDFPNVGEGYIFRDVNNQAILFEKKAY